VFADLPDMLGIPDVLGATCWKDKRVIVDESLDLEGKEGRLAFTLAHEAGHWHLHRPLIEADLVTVPLFSRADLPAQPAIVCRTSQRKVPAEWQADKFAAYLLMPSADVRASVRALCGDVLPTWERVEERRKSGELDEQLKALAAEVIERTNVSNQAMRFRLLDLKLVVDASNPQRSLL
jgi:Zn-dependent peptidase ImmA (M78 family)